MPDLWMDVDTVLSEVPVNKVALIDDTDFKTREESVVYNQAGMDLVWNFVTTAGAYTQTAVTPTTAGDYDWSNQLNGMYSIEMPASAGASINNDTEGHGWFTGFATGILPWTGPIVGFRAAALNNALIDGGDNLDTNVVQWLGTAVVAPTTAGVPTTALSAIGLDAIVSTATGMVEIAKAIWDRVLTGATHNIATSAGRRLRGIQEFQGYEGGAIWVDTVNGAAGTVDYENGTVENPVLTWADALTLAASLGFTRYEIVNGSTITLTATLNNSVLKGDRWTLALGGQDTGGSHFDGATVSGANSGTQTHFEKCTIGTCSLSLFHIENSSFNGTITLLTAGDYLIADSHSGIAGASTPVINTGAALANTNLSMRRHSGGVEIQNLNATGTDLFSIEGVGQIIYAASSSGAVNQRGDWKVTNTGGATIISDDNTANLGIITDTDGVILGAAGVALIWDRVISKANHNVAGSAGKILRQAGDLIQIDGVISDAGPTTSDFDTNLTGYGDGYFTDSLFLFANGAANGGISKPVTGYTSATGNFQFASPDIWPNTPVDTDDFDIIGFHVHPVSQIQSGLATEAKQDIINANVDLILSDTTDILALIAVLNDISTADVLAQVNAALDTAIAELGVAAPTATPTLRTGLVLLYMMARNRVDVDTSGIDAMKVYNDAGTQIASKTITDDDTDYSEAKMS